MNIKISSTKTPTVTKNLIKIIYANFVFCTDLSPIYFGFEFPTIDFHFIVS